MNILVTGGTGFIGSHTVVELVKNKHNVVIVDNFVNSDKKVLHNLEKITGKPVTYAELDVRSTIELTELMVYHSIDTVIHFAALKAVGESVQKPLDYYRNNISGLLSVLEAMHSAGVNNLVFSSSATVYGDPDVVPISENAPLKPATNPYGATKQMAEQIIQDVCRASNLRAVILRYFNPIGAHSSGLIGELPKGAPNNLVPFVTQVAAGLRDRLTVHADDYQTPDGSGIRDYIHVVDLAKAHVKSIAHLKQTKDTVTILNIGTGKGASVLEVINTFEKVNGVKVSYAIGPRRAGDIASCYASPAKAEKILGWKAELSLEQALKDAWNWQQKL
jgi:UDP-glucose 4-epimerase